MLIIIESKQLDQTGKKLEIGSQDTFGNKNYEYFVAARDISYCLSNRNISEAWGNNHAEYSNEIITNSVFLAEGLYIL